MFGNLGQIADLIKNAGKLREQMERQAEELGRQRFDGEAGGGVVAVQISGHLEVLAVRIDPKLVTDGDRELLEDLVLAATNEAIRKARSESTRSLSALTGGLPIPGMSDLLGQPRG